MFRTLLDVYNNALPFLCFLRFIPPFPNFEALGSPHLYKLLLQLLEREILSCCLKIASLLPGHHLPSVAMKILIGRLGHHILENTTSYNNWTLGVFFLDRMTYIMERHLSHST